MCIEKKETTDQKEVEEKIVLPEEVQIEMMKFFLRTSIPRKKREEQEKQKARLSNINDRSEE